MRGMIWPSQLWATRTRQVSEPSFLARRSSRLALFVRVDILALGARDDGHLCAVDIRVRRHAVRRGPPDFGRDRGEAVFTAGADVSMPEK
jgi:hypothetical protein